MEKFELINRLKDTANISSGEAKGILENNNWDILEAIVYLEKQGRIKGPSVPIFYTNESKESYINKEEIINISTEKEWSKSKSKSGFEGFFEVICKSIDTCNNIFIEIERHDKMILRIPLTVLVLLLFFAFWIIIPLMIVGLFFDIEFLVWAKSINTDEINNILKKVSKKIQIIKDKFKKGV